jgi:hypothetical protein
MSKHKGDYSLVAEELGISSKAVQHRVGRDPSLRAIWISAGDGTHQPNEVETLIRKDPPPEPEPKALVNALKENGKEVFMRDLKGMFSNPDSATKLDIFKEFDSSVGSLLGEALKVTQKMAIRQNMSMFEMAEKLRDDILGGSLDTEEEILKTRLFLQTSEQQGKFYDRILHGLDLMLKMTEKDKGEKKRKAGFQPLKDLKKHAEATEN